MKLGRTQQMAAIRRARAKTVIRLGVSPYTKTDALFAANLIKKTPVTAEVLAQAKARAERTRVARSAVFLDKYRAKAA